MHQAASMEKRAKSLRVELFAAFFLSPAGALAGGFPHPHPFSSRQNAVGWHRIWLDSAGDSAALTKHRRRIGRRGRQRDLALHSHFGFSRCHTVPCNSRALCISPLTDSVVATGAAGDFIFVLGLRIGQGTGAAPYARDVSTHHRSLESRLTAGSRFCAALRARVRGRGR